MKIVMKAKMGRIIIIVLFLFIVFSCMTMDVNNPYINANKDVFIRDFLTELELEELSIGNIKAYGLILFTNKAVNDLEIEKHKKILELYQKRFIYYKDTTDNENIIKYSTFMVVKEEIIKDEISYEEFLGIYNFQFSQEMIGYLNESNKEIANTSSGPYLVAFKDPIMKINTNSEYVYLDLSVYETTDLNAAFKLWRRFLTFELTDWEMACLKVRDEYINLFNKYSDFFLTLISS